MQKGDFVYIRSTKQYGHVHEITASGRPKIVKLLEPEPGKPDIIYVLDKIVEAVGIIRYVIILIKSFFK